MFICTLKQLTTFNVRLFWILVFECVTTLYSDGKRDDKINPNLDRPSDSRPSTFNPSENLIKLGLVNSHCMPPSEGDYISGKIMDGTVSQESSLVDGASCSIHSIDSSTRTSSASSRPHQVDAVHPFFNGYRSVTFDKSTSTDDQVFFCRQCEISIELQQDSVNQHFLTTQHTPIEENCVYCNTAVYEYFYRENVYYYHRCPNERQQNQSFAIKHVSDGPRPSSNKSPNEQEAIKPVSDKPTKTSFCDVF